MTLLEKIFWWLLVIGLAVSVDIVAIRIWRQYRQLKHAQDPTAPAAKRGAMLKEAIQIEFTSDFWGKLRSHTLENVQLRKNLQYILEMGAILIWAIIFGRDLLDFNPYTWPWGREFGSQIVTHHLWTSFQECGGCALWNGDINGGSPAFADIFGSMLHPVVILTTLMWGTVIGTKVSLVISLAMAGIAQWWIALRLSVGSLGRIWGALMVIVAGHLAGRMENAAFGIVLSTATASLLLAAILELGLKKNRRAMVLLALLGALTIVAGQGYLQLGVLVWSPAALFLILDKDFRLDPVWKKYAFALLLSFLLAGVFLVPMLHFLPETYKDIDPNFEAAQPLEYLLLNLVIRDSEYFNSTLLGKLPYPYLYNIYIGWIPVLFALACLRFHRPTETRLLLALASGVGLVFLAASGLPFRWLAEYVPRLGGFRHIPLVAGFAIPGIIGLAAYGFERIWHLKWPQIEVSFNLGSRTPRWQVQSRWVLLLALFASISLGYKMNVGFLRVEDRTALYHNFDSLQTLGLQWVAPPFGELFWVEPALHSQLKLTNVVWAWNWKNRADPEPYLYANRPGVPEGYSESNIFLDGIPVYLREQATYASILSDDSQQPCRATGSGGALTVYCDSSSAGNLIVRENSWAGWKAWRDGDRTELTGERWLEVTAPAGKHIYHFRYNPWDVPLGLFLTLMGLALCVYLWRANPSGGPKPPDSAPTLNSDTTP